ncbi:MAG: peptidoglycan bridge formation glycyltransferase FemA/FemB family protein [Nitrospirae bacterium]|nr:peptidoglycan bridge formation glycyltransferase FemA/FemB family protein [Nitrospirota bacterium]
MSRATLRVHFLDGGTGRPPFQEEWERAVRKAGDVYYEISYLAATADHDGGRITLCLYRHAQGLVIHPFVLRPLKGLPLGGSSPRPQFDLTSPFEYGGPVAYAETPMDVSDVRSDFRRDFSEFCEAEGIVSEFVRFHPLLRNHEDWNGYFDLRGPSPHPVIDLRKGPDGILNGFAKSARRDVRIAQRRGIQVTRVPMTGPNLSIFCGIYWGTMERRRAKSFYYFSSDYFSRLGGLDDRWVSLYFARDEGGRVLSAALFLHGDKYVHYHLAGTLEGVNPLCPGELLMFTAASEMAEAGKEWLHLGGAAADQDGLLRFKSKFARTRVDYFIGERIHDPVAYARLEEEWAAEHPPKVGAPTGDFFPAYRA